MPRARRDTPMPPEEMTGRASAPALEPGEIAARLARLAKLGAAAAWTVSVYLDARRTDEHRRNAARLFLARQIAAARATRAGARLAADLDWIAKQGRRLLEDQPSRARGVALFACAPRGVREVFAVEAAFAPCFVVAPAPYLAPLTAAANEPGESLVVMVDSRRARLVPFGIEGLAEGVALASDVPGRHRQGGWSLLAQSRYRRHIEELRGRHLAAVALAVGEAVRARSTGRIILAGAARNVAAFRKHLSRTLAARVAGSIHAAVHESDAVLVGRAARLLARPARASTRQAAAQDAGRKGRTVPIKED